MNTEFTGNPSVIDGYVRLSRDDNKHNYSSIENQKKIIQQYARENNMIVRRIYEDDGISGYSFNRPEFQKMISDLENIQIIVAKDLSRIGRHNAKVLLFLEQMEEMGVRVILIDDNYDSLYADDDMIGIKTWDNERHVKSTSRKVKRVKRMEQENGTLLSQPPFGYMRHPLNRHMVLIDQEAASILHLEKELYLDGNGLRKTAGILTSRGVPTPSMLEKERYDALGISCGRRVAYRWSGGMVRDTLFNDYNNGVLRTHKRERITINGKDKKIPKEQQFVFPDHHPKIFDDETMKLLCETRESRHHSRYRGQKTHTNLFSGCLYCSDCGRKLTAINRPNRPKYYICGTYNKKGTQFCPCSHQVEESVLLDALIQYLSLCRDSLADDIKDFNVSALKNETYTLSDSRERVEDELSMAMNKLKLLTSQKIKELAANPGKDQIIEETYASLQLEEMERISSIKKALEHRFREPCAPPPLSVNTPDNDLELLDMVLEKQGLDRRDIEILVQRIVVDNGGNAEIYLKHGLGRRAVRELKPDIANLCLQLLIETIGLLEQDTTGYTSVKYLSDSLSNAGYAMHKKKFVSYMEHLLEWGLVEKTGIYHKPYKIAASIQRLRDIKKILTALGQTEVLPSNELIWENIRNRLAQQQLL